MKAEYLNTFIMATRKVLTSFGVDNVDLGKPFLTNAVYDGDKLLISVGVTGELKGQVIFEMDFNTACAVASAMMMGMPVNELNELTRSAVCELTNMILGNTATYFTELNKSIDITPPTTIEGKNMSFQVADTPTICIPMVFKGNTIDINVAIKEITRK